ncbi:integumentary mucin C.1-like [Gopherus flavomarginatus]|uniref:integumentary mucin C.1-like n=1 Tax=Gopherus flavomarginatus TaxID=286002 RepID=UPI0021CBCA82|nr:integumentary mucin C.1-like [Gopherus flavomarginatus]
MPNTTTTQGYVPTGTETGPSVLVSLTPPRVSTTAVQTTAPTSVTTSPTEAASTMGSSTETLITSTTANTTTAVSTTAATEVPRTVRATTVPAGNMTATFPAAPNSPATQNFSTAPTTGSAANPNSTALPWVPGVPTEEQMTALPPCHPPAANPTDARLFLSLGLTTHLNLSEPQVRGMVLSKLEQDLNMKFPCSGFTVLWKGEGKK